MFRYILQHVIESRHEGQRIKEIPTPEQSWIPSLRTAWFNLIDDKNPNPTRSQTSCPRKWVNTQIVLSSKLNHFPPLFFLFQFFVTFGFSRDFHSGFCFRIQFAGADFTLWNPGWYRERFPKSH